VNATPLPYPPPWEGWLRQRPDAFTPGDTLVNPALRLRSVLLETNNDVMRSRVEATAGASGGPLHVHPRQEERFVVEEGTLRVRTGLLGARRVAAGESIVVPARRPHTFRVEGGGARFVAEFRPPHRIGELFVELFALAADGRLDKRGNPRPADLARLMERYPEDFFYAPLLPHAMQRRLMRVLGRRSAREPS
jgi:mannose-6-phosphate isomerase-like protein (cupin superfamily)